MSYICGNCGAGAENPDNLCQAEKEAPPANFCGIPEEWICESNMSKMNYSCKSCGSLSASPDNLCSPGRKM